jgi:low affinity Fe/Cu permease
MFPRRDQDAASFAELSKHSRGWLEVAAGHTTEFAGSTTAFSLAVGGLVAWAAVGPLAQFSETWQLVVNTGTTIVTFLMVFIVQRTQNKDSRALHLKLNELLAAVEGASDRLLNVEDASEKELKILHDHFDELARLAAREHDVARSHSIEQSHRRHEAKYGGASE